LTKVRDTLRPSLANWYKTTRRKLPWRGDVQPEGGWDGRGTLDGSALDLPASKASTKTATISSFFASTTTTTTTTTTTSTPPSPSPSLAPTSLAPAIPITPYSIWISETMLQQTRVAAVIPFFLAWLASFPSVTDVASASEDSINKHWAGLGFYRRARYLHEGAKHVVKHHTSPDGTVAFPTDVPTLLKIPGIGPYTAGAIASIYANTPTPAVDGNVLRVLARVTGVAADVKGRYLTHFGTTLASVLYEDWDPTINAKDFNQGLMELGATYCATKGTGQDPADPLSPHYMTTQLANDVQNFLSLGGDPQTLLDLASKCKCEVCNEKNRNGVSIFLTNLLDSAAAAASTESLPTTLPTLAHQSIPLEPPKKGKRDEIIRVAVLRRTSDGKMLFCKRGPGLLEKQWEMPQFTADVKLASDGGGVDKHFECRQSEEHVREGLDSVLKRILSNSSTEMGGLKQSRRVINSSSPLVHVFTHVRHFLTIEVGDVEGVEELRNVAGNTENYTEYAWFGESELAEVGVTSAITKIIKMVNEGGGGGGGNAAAKKKRPAEKTPKPQEKKQKQTTLTF
jgi:A/G-specific adenine glycosylase